MSLHVLADVGSPPSLLFDGAMTTAGRGLVCVTGFVTQTFHVTLSAPLSLLNQTIQSETQSWCCKIYTPFFGKNLILGFVTILI